jgi:hypothetical protein
LNISLSNNKSLASITFGKASCSLFELYVFEYIIDTHKLFIGRKQGPRDELYVRATEYPLKENIKGLRGTGFTYVSLNQ